MIWPRAGSAIWLLMNGGFNPLEGFSGEDDSNGVGDDLQMTGAHQVVLKLEPMGLIAG